MKALTLSFEEPIIVAVSGGADSLCLLGTLHEQGYSLIVAHFDHQLRPESAEGAKFVAWIAAQYELPFLCGTTNVNAYAKEHKQTIEEAARNSRYQFFFEQARQHNAQAVAVGHTADDQVETVLMHFLRGAGLSGLKGIQPSTILPAFDAEIPLVRPILHLRRVDTEAWCADHNISPLEDPTNTSRDYFRNRLRHVLIPELEKYNPRFRDVVIRSSQTLSGDHALLMELIKKKWAEITLVESPHHASFSLSSFSELSIPLIRNLIRHGMEKLLPGQVDISFSTLERAAHFISSSDSAQRIDLASGLLLFKERDALHLTTDMSNLPLDAFPQLQVIASGAKQSPSLDNEIALAIKLPRNETPFELELGSGWVLTVSESKTRQVPINTDPFQVMLDADVLGSEVLFRPRQVGDAFRPLGMEGRSVKIKDFFINEKLPRRARDRYPLLCTENEIVWIPGYRPAHRFRLTDITRRVVVFKLKRL